MLADGFYRRQQVAAGIGLDDVTACSGLERLLHHLRRVMLRDDQDFALRKIFSNLPAGLQAVEFGHADIEHDNIGTRAFCFFYRFESVPGLADDFPILLEAKQRLQPMSDKWMIVHKQNANRCCSQISILRDPQLRPSPPLL
jgi:hypothetical protein